MTKPEQNIDTGKLLLEAAYLLEEYANDHGYCEICRSSDCDPEKCRIAKCIADCRELAGRMVQK